ncbi:MAG: hypothetical protein ACRDG3_09915 [Tepidiformaceae bacterium]
MAVTIHLAVSDASLRRALVSRLVPILGNGLFAGVPPIERTIRSGDVIVSPAADLSIDDCARLSGRGVHVIILAPLPRPAEEERYAQAGAAGYLPMAVDTGPLVTAIEHAAFVV